MFRGLILTLFLAALIPFPAAAQGIDTLTVLTVTSPPTIDGVVDALWNDALTMTVALGETYDVNDPASIMDCAGCHAFDSAITVELKAVRTTDQIVFLATWPDPTASFTRGGSWSFANDTWEKPNSEQSEDRISFLWPIGTIVGSPYDTGGCMSKCHNYWPTDTDPHVSEHGIVDDAWLASGRADMWHAKAARGAAVLGASGSGLTIDPVTHEVTAGTFSMLGFADDKYVDVWSPDSINGEDGGRYGDDGTSAYSHNRIGDHSRPKYMEIAPDDYADAMILTQDEIDDAECVGDATTGVSDADAATCWPAYETLDAVVPERILRMPAGSRADLAFGAVWHDGVWTAEMARPMQTGNADDVQFDAQNAYLFGIAEFDNSRHGYQHRTSEMYTLLFGSGVGIGERGEARVPRAFGLAQNHPNPFNPVTTISFDLDRAGRVALRVYDIRGRMVRTLAEGTLPAGHHRYAWDGRDDRGSTLPSGIYVYRLEAEGRTSARKMILLK